MREGISECVFVGEGEGRERGGEGQKSEITDF